MSMFIDTDVIELDSGTKLPPRYAQTGYYDIRSLPQGRAITTLSGFSGKNQSVVVLLLFKENDWQFFGTELVTFPKFLSLTRHNINYYLSQKIPQHLYAIYGYLPIDELESLSPDFTKLAPLAVTSELPVEQDCSGLSWLQIDLEGMPEGKTYIADLTIQVNHVAKTYSISGVLYRDGKELRMSDVLKKQKSNTPLLHLPILKQQLVHGA